MITATTTRPFTTATRLSLQAHLIAEFDRLLYPSLEYLQRHFTSYRRVSFESIADKQGHDFLDFDACINFILDSKLDIENTILTYKLLNGEYWSANDIRYPFTLRYPKPPAWGTAPRDQYDSWRDDLEYTCQAEFWQAEPIPQGLDALLSIDLFTDRRIPAAQLYAYQRGMTFSLNKDHWLYFVDGLVQYYFPAYRYHHGFSTTVIRRHVIELRENLWFGIEYSRSDIARELKRGIPDLPEFFNLVLIRTGFQRSCRRAQYYLQPNDFIMSLGMLGNPFFYHPCYPMPGYSTVDSAKSSRLGQPYLYRFEPVDDDTYQLTGPQAYGDSMKKHAIFYMDLLASTAAPYLDYLHLVLNKALVE